MSNFLPSKIMNVDEKLFGDEQLEKPEPQLGEECLVWDGIYNPATVTAVDTDKREYEALLTERGSYVNSINFTRYRPVS